MNTDLLYRNCVRYKIHINVPDNLALMNIKIPIYKILKSNNFFLSFGGDVNYQSTRGIHFGR